MDEVARRLGKGERHCRRLCGDQWWRQGLARQERPKGGGKACWYVREDACPELAPVLMPELLTFDSRGLTEEQRAEHTRRMAVVTGWEKARAAAIAAGTGATEAMERYRASLAVKMGTDAPSAETIYAWRRRYREGGRGGLADGRWRPERKVERASDEFLRDVARRYLDNRRPTLTVCIRDAKALAAVKGWKVYPYHTCRRFIESLDPALVLKLREGEDAYTRKGETYIERDYSKLVSNEQWCGDHHQFDVIVRHRGKLVRPWLTAWMDMRSRKIVGWCIVGYDPNQDSILAALRHGVLSHGVPSSFYIDNGKDYDSYALNGRTKWERHRGKIILDKQRLGGVFQQLGCDVHHCWVYHGQSKPVERFFGTMEEGFGKSWDTYCGNKPENKPEDLQQHLDKGHAPELADFIAAFGQWLECDYHEAVHGGDAMEGRSPARVYAESWRGTTKRIVAEDMMDALLSIPTKPVKVGRNGVTWSGMRYGQHDLTLRAMLGKEVCLRIDERDVSHVQVWTPAGRFVCLADANVRVAANATREDLRAAINLKRHTNKVSRDYHRQGLWITPDVGGLLEHVRAEHRRQAAENTPPADPDGGPGAVRMVQPAQAGEVEKLRRAQERRRSHKLAAGAEGLDLLAMAADLDVSAPARRALSVDIFQVSGGD